jgi:hypothetical protein
MEKRASDEKPLLPREEKEQQKSVTSYHSEEDGEYGLDVQIQTGESVTETGFVVAIEQAMLGLAIEMAELRKEVMQETAAGRRTYPRLELLIDSNCLISFTGPLADFDQDYFKGLVSDLVAARMSLDIIEAGGEDALEALERREDEDRPEVQ